MPPALVTPDQPCPLWRRMTALVYDALIVVAIVMVVGLLCQVATGGKLISTGAHTVIPVWYQALQGLVVAGYFVSSWLRGGQTVGMRAWRIRLTDAHGNGVSMRHALIRLGMAAAPLALLVLANPLGLKSTLWAVLAAWAVWFAVGLFDRRRRALHDVVALTEIRCLG